LICVHLRFHYHLLPMDTADLDFHLPPELIAQAPADRREASRLLHYRRDDRSIAHRHFADLPDLLRPGDLLVLNDTRVLPARLEFRKRTGGRIEGLFLREIAPGQWRVLLRGLGASRPTLHFTFAPDLTATPGAHHGEGEYDLALNTTEPADTLLQRVGRMPLPPYIKRHKEHDPLDDTDRQRYQTVYARAGQSVAAPTAGLHFTPALFDALAQRGIEKTFITLTVGLGTFKPVTAERLDQHTMHTESYTLSPDAADALNRAKQNNSRIIAVGTTSARVLESQPPDRPFQPTSADTSIFIYAPYTWRHVSALITNFHLPKSTLIALVAAFITLPEQRRLYTQAIAHHYRFFSYGDASFLE
jgi:S-adenosylmethionine:tRNA ribosyltransferase-isomerase